MSRIADVFKFAAGGGVLEGKVAVACLDRLLDQLAGSEGEVCWELSGSIDAEGRPRLDLAVSGRLVLFCQRCLGGLDWELKIETALLPVRAGQDLPEDELENDKVDAVEVDGEFDVLSLVEDEIILALPIAPRHADCGMPGEAGTNGGVRRESPFATLAGLRGKEIL